MASCNVVLQTAYRRAGVLPLNMPMNDGIADAGMLLLKTWFQEKALTGFFGKLEQKYNEADTTIEADMYEFYNCVQTLSSFTPPANFYDVNEGVTRPPYHMAVCGYIDPSLDTPKVFIFDSFANKWTDVFALTLNSYCPLSTTNRKQLEALFAALLAEENGLQLTPLVALQARGANFHLAARVGVPKRPSKGVFE